jgi:CRP/FNR family cyclic AMP-dependent transcriptional regulator
VCNKAQTSERIPAMIEGPQAFAAGFARPSRSRFTRNGALQQFATFPCPANVGSGSVIGQKGHRGGSHMERRKSSNGAARRRTFDAQAFLDSAGLAKRVVQYARGDVIFSQGGLCKHVLYIQTGGVKLSVLSKAGREAVVAMLGPGDFFGEGCLAGQPVRMGSATAMTPSTILLVGKKKMIALLHQQHAMSDRFIAHMLARNIRIEEDLIDQLFNSSEKRLARTLLLLARYGKQDKPTRVLPRLSQETLAEMVGTTRSRVNFFLNKFKKLGFIDYDGELPVKVNSSLLSVVLHD